MENLYIAPTDQSPEINFAYSEHRLHIQGESYPENAMAFYAPVRASLAQYLAAPVPVKSVEVSISLRYFNSSSTKIIRLLMALLNGSAQSGRRVVALWYHDPEDDMMMEFGMDLRDEFRMMDVQVVALP
jgi:hypothetical protein